MNLAIRREGASDHEAIRQVNQLAFGRDDEARLVDALRDGGYVHLSLVAEVDGNVVGHILFSELPIITESGVVAALALAPMAVAPEQQRRGIGSRLVERGLDACREDGHRIVIVLGHPEFYPRFNFSAELARPLASPFSMPAFYPPGNGGGKATCAVTSEQPDTRSKTRRGSCWRPTHLIHVNRPPSVDINFWANRIVCANVYKSVFRDQQLAIPIKCLANDRQVILHVPCEFINRSIDDAVSRNTRDGAADDPTRRAKARDV